MIETNRLSLTGINHRFGLQPVIQDMDIQVSPGQVVALVGPSGCGKTTLLKIAAGLLKPEEGGLTNGFSSTAVLFQEPRLLPWKRAIDNIGWGLKIQGKSRTEQRRIALKTAAKVGLTRQDIEKFPHQLSGGMRQRVALARALALSPNLLLLDEPFSALDVGLKRELYQLLLQEIQRRSLGVLFITHDVMEAVHLADQVLVLSANPGKIAHTFNNPAPPAERNLEYQYQTSASLLAQPQVAQAFGVKP